MMLRAFAYLALFVLLAGCDREPVAERHAFFALGTLVEISVFAPPDNIDTALRATERALLAEERRWRAWGDGELAALNRQLAAGASVAFSDEIAAGVQRAREIATASGERFNPAMGRLVETWGFHDEERNDLPPPSDDTLRKLLPASTLASLVQSDQGWHSTDPALWLDMGAFAKGLAVDVAIDTLREHGIDNAIVNAGGDLKVIGRHGERPWRIGVRNPRGDGVLAAIEARDGESVFTSGDYERFFEWQGERFHHILDPATGWPARGVTSVTVIHPDAALADAAATALFVAGRNDWTATAKALGIEHAMLVFDNGHVALTPAMESRVVFDTEPGSIEIATP